MRWERIEMESKKVKPGCSKRLEREKKEEIKRNLLKSTNVEIKNGNRTSSSRLILKRKAIEGTKNIRPSPDIQSKWNERLKGFKTLGISHYFFILESLAAYEALEEAIDRNLNLPTLLTKPDKIEEAILGVILKEDRVFNEFEEAICNEMFERHGVLLTKMLNRSNYGIALNLKSAIRNLIEVHLYILDNVKYHLCHRINEMVYYQSN